MINFGSILGGILELRTAHIDQKKRYISSLLIKWLLGEVWDAILDDFGTYLGAILEALESILVALGGLLEALESILGAVGGFGRGNEDPQRFLALFWGREGQSQRVWAMLQSS